MYIMISSRHMQQYALRPLSHLINVFLRWINRFIVIILSKLTMHTKKDPEQKNMAHKLNDFTIKDKDN